jgi:spermidine synthase
LVVRHNGLVRSQQPKTDPRKTVFLLGFATAFAQALLLREAMAAMGGSEMAWGTVMALWLVGMSVGARIGVRVGTQKVSHLLPSLVIFLAGVGIILFRAAPALVGVAAGESITTSSAFWLWTTAILPAALAGGLAFPILAAQMGDSGAGRAFALEAIGALAGGVILSLILVGLGSAAAISISFGTVAATATWRHSRLLAGLLMLVGFAAALPSGDLLARAGWRWADRPGDLRAWRETRLQRLEVTAGPPTAVYADGRLLASYPDPYTVIPKAHLLMLLHPEPRRVLTVGCVADGSVEAMVEHPIDELIVVEEDPQLLSSLADWYGPRMEEALSLPRIRPLVSDPLRAVNQENALDMIVLLDGNPSTLRRNRTRTLEFLRSCSTRMKPSGILILRAVVADTYLGGAGGRLLAILAATMREVFPQVRAIPGEEVLLIGGGPDAQLTLDASILANRLAAGGLAFSALLPEMLTLLLDPDRSRAVEQRISAAAPTNTINTPRAVLVAGGLHEGRSRSSLLRLAHILERRSAWPLGLGLGLAVLGLLATTLRRRPPGASTAAVVGFCSMGWWLLLIACWQSTRGSVYSEVGALTASFMGGLAGGAALTARLREPEKRLPFILAAGVLLSLSVAAGLALHSPLIAIPVLLATSGFLTGAAFPGMAVLTSHNDTRRRAGIAFAADEAGAACAALLVGIIAIPWGGLVATAAALATLQLSAIPAVVVALRRR